MGIQLKCAIAAASIFVHKLQMIIIFPLALLANPVAPQVAQATCQLPLGAAVPDAATASAIASAVASARRSSPEKYQLVVKPDPSRPGSWWAAQTLPQPRSSKPGEVVVRSGGGGLEMRIDGCTGAISDMRYSR